MGGDSWGFVSGIDGPETMNFLHEEQRTTARHTEENCFERLMDAETTGEDAWWHCPRWNDVRERYGHAEMCTDTWSCALRDLGAKLNTDDGCDLHSSLCCLFLR